MTLSLFETLYSVSDCLTQLSGVYTVFSENRDRGWSLALPVFWVWILRGDDTCSVRGVLSDWERCPLGEGVRTVSVLVGWYRCCGVVYSQVKSSPSPAPSLARWDEW